MSNFTLQMEVVYIETTIVSYLVARSSRDLVLAAHQQVTRDWWDTERMNYQCVISTEVLREAAAGDVEMSRLRLAALDEMEVIRATPEIDDLASAFLNTGALPASMRSDAVHLAAATLAGADYLLTWNCRHLANAHVLKRLHREAGRQGWTLPDVCTPLELMKDSDP
jgi:hypothetical protein